MAGQVSMDVVDRLDAAAPAALCGWGGAAAGFADASLPAHGHPARGATGCGALRGGRDTTADPAADSFTQSVPGMGSMFVMFTVMAGWRCWCANGSSGRCSGWPSCRCAEGGILGGKPDLAYFTLGMIQYQIIFGVGWALGTNFGPRPARSLAVMVRSSSA
ncbi:MAG: hypothetical protein R2851_04850 [Caldilineaceae bacterium]